MAAHDFFVGCGIAALEALILGLCNRRYGATQYALLSAAAGLAGRLAATPSGWLATRLGWPAFFVASAAAGLIALISTAPAAMAPSADRATGSPPNSNGTT